MAQQDIAAAVQRVRSALHRRPEAGIHDDAPATAHWDHDVSLVIRHADGAQVLTDMPRELGGSGEQVTPGWLFRAALASCAATSIALAAAAEGIALSALEVTAASRSDARGLLGMADEAGAPVYAGPGNVALHVKISAAGLSLERLQAWVESSLRHSPVPNALTHATALALHVEAHES